MPAVRLMTILICCAITHSQDTKSQPRTIDPQLEELAKQCRRVQGVSQVDVVGNALNIHVKLPEQVIKLRLRVIAAGSALETSSKRVEIGFFCRPPGSKELTSVQMKGLLRANDHVSGCTFMQDDQDATWLVHTQPLLTVVSSNVIERSIITLLRRAGETQQHWNPKN